jgi:hypothetical protein
VILNEFSWSETKILYEKSKDLDIQDEERMFTPYELNKKNCEN